MTMTRPWRRMTLHLSQIGLTLGLTFTAVPSPCSSWCGGDVLSGELWGVLRLSDYL